MEICMERTLLGLRQVVSQLRLAIGVLDRDFDELSSVQTLPYNRNSLCPR
jgi:hypothetical protein